MANRYANLVGSNKIKDEWTKINAGFDAVQADMDAKPDKSIARVNNLQMDADDTLTIEGGTGIAVTTNPNNKKVTITATGTSTPGAHGSSHTEFGADPIPNATTTEGGLMSAADKKRLDGATSTATPNTIVQRDANGRFKAAAPAAADDVARKAEVDGKVSKSGDMMTGNLAFGDGRGILLRNGDNDSYLTLGDFPESKSSNVEVRLFRNTNTSGQKRLYIMRGDGSATVEFGITDGEIVVVKGVVTKITAGNGSPEGRVTANPGSIYLNRSGGAGVSIWVKESGTGNTGWVAK